MHEHATTEQSKECGFIMVLNSISPLDDPMASECLVLTGCVPCARSVQKLNTWCRVHRSWKGNVSVLCRSFIETRHRLDPDTQMKMVAALVFVGLTVLSHGEFHVGRLSARESSSCCLDLSQLLVWFYLIQERSFELINELSARGKTPARHFPVQLWAPRQSNEYLRACN